MESIGERIRKKRKALGLTRKELADVIGCSDKAIWLWEMGRSVPRPMNVGMIADALECSIDDLTEYKPRTVGENLRRARMRAGIPARTASALSGIAESLIYGIENGQRDMRVSTLVKLAGVLNCKAADMLAGVDA